MDGAFRFAQSPPLGHWFRNTSFSRFLQPAGEILRCDRAVVAILFPPSGLLAPGVERAFGQPAGVDAGETLFVLPAVFLEHLVALLALRPCVDTPMSRQA